MQLQPLIALARAVCELAPDRSVVLVGSGSLLARFPELGDDGQPLAITYDADFLIEPMEEDFAHMLVERLGSQSESRSALGCFADILSPGIRSMLPRDWERRLIPLPGFEEMNGLDPYDAAIAKLIARRHKDLRVLSVLLADDRLQKDLLDQCLIHSCLHEAQIALAASNLEKALRLAEELRQAR